MAGGRPTKYTDKLATEICRKMICGESLRSICKSDKMPNKSTVLLWVAEDREGFSDQYAKAFEARMILHADELLDIADDSVNDFMERDGIEMPDHEVIARSRLRIDTRKWLLSKMLPRFADKKEAQPTEDLAAALLALASKLPD